MMDPPGVSRETAAKLVQYEALILKWQRAVNLVGPKTLSQIQERHFADSLQVLPLIPNTAKVLFDFGTGAGFPGMIIAMARPDLRVTLVDSDQKKCSFLQAVSRETKTPVTICNSRIEAATLPVPDVITARALAPLKELLDLSIGFAQANASLILIFMKGRGAVAEIEEAGVEYLFDLESRVSVTDPDAVILQIRRLRRRET